MPRKKPTSEKLVTVPGCLSPAEVAALKKFSTDRDWPNSKAVRRLVAEGLRNLGYLEAEERATAEPVAA